MIALVICTTAFIYFIYLLVKPYFSSLSHIPEPPLWPILHHTPYFLMAKDIITLFENWGEKFKEEGLFKLNTVYSDYGCFVVLLKPEYAKVVFSRPDQFKRNDYMQKYFPLTGEGLLVATGDYHRFQKKLLGKTFSLGQLKHYVPVFNKHVSIMIKLWTLLVKDEENGKNVEVKKYFNNMSFDIIGEIGFGYQFNSQTTQTNPFVATFKEQCEGVVNMKSRFILKFFPFMWHMPFGPAKILRKSVQAAEKVLSEVLSVRKEKISTGSLTEQEENDLLSMMMNEKDEKTGTGFSDQLIKDNGYTFFIAGHETTATALPGILFYFTKYPDFQERARTEVKETFQGREELTMDDLSSIPYTTAFIKECLRFFTPIAFNGRLSCVDYNFGKYKIPKGTMLLVSTGIMNKDKESFDKSEEFIPERYLDDNEMKSGTSFTFGYGPYSCIGKNFAIQEIKLVIGRLLQKFKFSIDPENEEFYRKSMLTMKTIPEIKIRVSLL